MTMSNILSCLENAGTVIIAGHTRPDGDCVGACMGLWHYIHDNYPHIRADVRLEPIPDSYKVVAGTDQIISTYDDDKCYDLFIALDASDTGRLAGAGRYFETAGHRICIDHHISNPSYADENYILPGASSTCEILADLMDMRKVSVEAATALYMGIICDTGVFKYSSTSHHTMDVAGQLMEKGIPYSDLIDGVFYRKTFMQNQLLGKCLTKAGLALDGRIIVCVVDRSVLDSFHAAHSDLEGVIDQLRVTEGIEVAVLASETDAAGYKFSLRSNHCVDVSSIAACFGGGGHVRAAGFSAAGDPWENYRKVEQMIKEQLEACTME